MSTIGQLSKVIQVLGLITFFEGVNVAENIHGSLQGKVFERPTTVT